MRDFINELLTPSQGFTETPQGRIYARTTIAVGHSVIGSTVAVVAAVTSIYVLYALVALYLAKEVRDYRMGGNKWDSAEDTMSVLIGALGYAVAPWASPLVALSTGFVVALVAALRQR